MYNYKHDYVSLLESGVNYPYRPVGIPQEILTYDGTTVYQTPNPSYWTVEKDSVASAFDVNAAGAFNANVAYMPEHLSLTTAASASSTVDVFGREMNIQQTIFESRLTIHDSIFPLTSTVFLVAFDNFNNSHTEGVQFSSNNLSMSVRWRPSGVENFNYGTDWLWTAYNSKPSDLIFRVFPQLGLACQCYQSINNVIVWSDLDATSSNPINDMTDAAWRIRLKTLTATARSCQLTRMTVENFA